MDKDKKTPGLTAFETIVLWFLVSFVIITLLNRAIYLLSGHGDVVFAGSRLYAILKSFLVPLLKFLSFVVSVFSVAGLVWSTVRLTQINALQKALYSPPVAISLEITPEKNIRWEKVMTHINSINPNDWKLAILEADIILDELMSAMGYHGETLSDKLKGVEKSDFLTIDEAWEAHKVRNQIAHEGSEYLITEREARRVIGLYEKVFREFSFI